MKIGRLKPRKLIPAEATSKGIRSTPTADRNVLNPASSPVQAPLMNVVVMTAAPCHRLPSEANPMKEAARQYFDHVQNCIVLFRGYRRLVGSYPDQGWQI